MHGSVQIGGCKWGEAEEGRVSTLFLHPSFGLLLHWTYADGFCRSVDRSLT